MLGVLNKNKWDNNPATQALLFGEYFMHSPDSAPHDASQSPAKGFWTSGTNSFRCRRRLATTAGRHEVFSNSRGSTPATRPAKRLAGADHFRVHGGQSIDSGGRR